MLVVAVAGITVYAQRALDLFHPSRDAHFTDDVSLGVARGLQSAELAVDRAALTTQTPAAPTGNALLVVVSNTYWWTPDRPTSDYLARARLAGVPAVGVIGGAGSTGRSRRVLETALSAAGAQVLTMRSLRLSRPNDEGRVTEPIRDVAIELAEVLGREAGVASRATGNKE